MTRRVLSTVRASSNNTASTTALLDVNNQGARAADDLLLKHQGLLLSSTNTGTAGTTAAEGSGKRGIDEMGDALAQMDREGQKVKRQRLAALRRANGVPGSQNPVASGSRRNGVLAIASASSRGGTRSQTATTDQDGPDCKLDEDALDASDPDNRKSNGC